MCDKVTNFVTYLDRMKYLIVTGIFLVGMSLGYVVGSHSATSAPSENAVDTGQSNTVQSNNTNTGNNRELNAAETTLQEMGSRSDSAQVNPGDSLLVDFMGIDSTLEGENISTEKLIKSVYIPIVYLSEENAKDSTMQELLGIDEVKTNSMFVEFWESPLNFEGYKLSKKKLIVYGLSSQFDYKLYKDGSVYYFSYQNIYYKMRETQDFLPFAEVSKSEVFND